MVFVVRINCILERAAPVYFKPIQKKEAAQRFGSNRLKASTTSKPCTTTFTLDKAGCAEARYNDDVVCDSSLDCSLTPLSINRLMQKHKGVLKMHNAAIKFTVRNEQLFVSPLKNSSIFVVNDDDLTEEITDKMTRRVGNGYILKFRSADDDGSEYVLSCEEFCPIEYA